MGGFIKKNNSGFTLIELLVVVAIIAIILGLLIVSINSSRGKGRDAKRVSDLQSIQTALELYRAANGFYPSTQATFDANYCWLRSNNKSFQLGAEVVSCNNPGTAPNWDALGSALKPYLASMPGDPLNKTVGTKNYYLCYQATPTDYKLQTQLEQNKNIMETDGGNGPDRYELFTNAAQPWGN